MTGDVRHKNMASSFVFTCDRCGYSIEAWDEGNPYIEFPAGNRHFFYHPGEMEEIRNITRKIIGREPTREDCDSALKQFSGNETDYICRTCQMESRFDPRKDPHACKHCGSSDVVAIFTLTGKKCIKCEGTFSEGKFACIS